MMNGNENTVNWYELWMKQNNEFFKTSEEYLTQLFANEKIVDPEQHMELITKWTKSLQQHWEKLSLDTEQKMFENYWKWLTKLNAQASEKTINEWITKNKTENPIKSIKDLYELWLSCSRQIYEEALQNPAYLKAYNDFITSSMKCWPK